MITPYVGRDNTRTAEARHRSIEYRSIRDRYEFNGGRW